MINMPYVKSTHVTRREHALFTNRKKSERITAGLSIAALLALYAISSHLSYIDCLNGIYC